MIYNYHTHTHRCGHAVGCEEEYIIRAIQGGIQYMGFSDHIPLMCDDGFESGHRVPMAEAEDYVKTLIALREKYSDKIDIKIGFEMEFYPDEFEKMLKSVEDLGAEYLILGQHWLENEHYGGQHVNHPTDSLEDLKKYVSLVVSAMKTGVITYVAHPDMIRFTGDVMQYRKEMKEICVASKELHIPLEINFLGISDGRNYPNPLFWKLAGEVQVPVTFGFDAHDPMRAFDEKSLKIAEKMVETYGLNYIGRPEIVSI